MSPVHFHIIHPSKSRLMTLATLTVRIHLCRYICIIIFIGVSQIHGTGAKVFVFSRHIGWYATWPCNILGSYRGTSCSHIVNLKLTFRGPRSSWQDKSDGTHIIALRLKIQRLFAMVPSYQAAFLPPVVLRSSTAQVNMKKWCYFFMSYSSSLELLNSQHPPASVSWNEPGFLTNRVDSPVFITSSKSVGWVCYRPV